MLRWHNPATLDTCLGSTGHTPRRATLQGRARCKAGPAARQGPLPPPLSGTAGERILLYLFVGSALQRARPAPGNYLLTVPSLRRTASGLTSSPMGRSRAGGLLCSWQCEASEWGLNNVMVRSRWPSGQRKERGECSRPDFLAARKRRSSPGQCGCPEMRAPLTAATQPFNIKAVLKC